MISYSYKAEFSSESAKIENVKIRKSLEQINVLLNELNLVNDIRMELSVEINDLINQFILFIVIKVLV